MLLRPALVSEERVVTARQVRLSGFVSRKKSWCCHRVCITAFVPKRHCCAGGVCASRAGAKKGVEGARVFAKPATLPKKEFWLAVLLKPA